MTLAILVVEDRPEIQMLFRAVIERLGYEALVCEDLETAGTMLDQHPAMVLTDLNLPDGSGIDLALTIRQRPDSADIPVVIVTAHPDAQKRIADSGLQGVGHLSKPFRFKQLMGVVERTLARMAADK